MKIAFVEPHLELYGGIRRVMELSNRLVALGEDVTLYHPTGEPCRWMEGLAPTQPTHALRHDAHDVLIFNEPSDYPIVRRTRARLRVFYILCLSEHDKLRKFNIKLFWPRRGRLLALKYALWAPVNRLANATWMHRYVTDELGLDCELLIGGVNRDVFHPVDVARDPNAFRILWTGDGRQRKGADTVEAALERVRARYPHVTVDTYHGRKLPQSAMAETYARADLFVDGQHYAGWNNPVAEAMACGTPVVCTAIGGVEDFAHHERTALLTPVGDVAAMAEAIERMIADPSLRDELSANAIKEIGRFDWGGAAVRLRDILARSLASSTAADGP